MDIVTQLMKEDVEITWEMRIEAAAKITRLREEAEQARKALEPFAEAAGRYPAMMRDADAPVGFRGFTIGHLRAAALIETAYREAWDDAMQTDFPDADEAWKASNARAILTGTDRTEGERG